MDDSIKPDIAVIKERIQNITDQVNRFIAHLESEQRVTSNISKRVDTLQSQVDRILDEKKEMKSNSRWKTETVLMILALATSIASLVVMAIKE